MKKGVSKYKFDQQYVEKCVNNGQTYREIAEHYNCDPRKISDFCVKNNIKSRMRQDLIGVKFGKFKVIENLGKKNGKNIWKCKCKCGNTRDMNTSDVNMKIRTSCGCSRKMQNHVNWSGIGDMPGKVFTVVKRGAKIRNLDFNITKQDLWDQFVKQDKKCALSGIDLHFNKIKDDKYGNCSLDREDNTKGYTVDNIQWVHTSINLMKQDYESDCFIEMCHLISDYNSSKQRLEKEKLDKFINYPRDYRSRSRKIKNE